MLSAQPIKKDLIERHHLADDELTEEEEAGLLASLAELDGGRGSPLADAIATIKRGARRS